MSHEVRTPSKQTDVMSSPGSRLASLLLTPGQTEELRAHSALCDRLGISESVKNVANSMWKSLRSGVDKEEGTIWYICFVYIASTDGRFPYGPTDPQVTNGALSSPSVTVSELLMASEINIVEFLKKMQQLRSQVPLSEAVRQHLNQVQRKYLITCPLYRKFEKIFNEVFLSDSKNDLTENGASNEQKEFLDRKKFAWTLTMYAKNSSTELVGNFHLMLCCLNYVIRLTPGFQLKAPFDSLCVASTGPEDHLSMLRALCDVYSANFQEVLGVQTGCLDPVIEGLPQVNGAIEVDKMTEEYRLNYKASGDIDELLFLDKEAHLTLNQSAQNTTNTQIASTPVMTPVRSAMTSIQHLRDLLNNVQSQGSPTLHAYFEKCAINPAQFISDLLTELKHVFLGGYTSLMGRGSQKTAEMRLDLAVKLYYRVMETLLKQESEERLSEVNFSHLLHNRTSHKCLLACALEVVMATYCNNTLKQQPAQSPGAPSDQNGLLFPFITKLFTIQAFDLFIVLENFINAEPNLSKEVLQHLQNIEDRILESEAWKEGSNLFEIINQSDIMAANDTMAESGQEENKNIRLKVQTPQGTSIQSPRVQRSRGLSQFLNGACKLAYKRLQILCTELKITKDTQHRIWQCVEHVISRRPCLLRQRHLDQITLCCIYAVCRVVDMEISFKAIVAVYKDLPHASPQVYKRVLVADGEYDSIIMFYNRIFTQVLKNYVLQFASSKAPPSSASSSNLHSPSTTRTLKASPLPASPSVARSIGKNFYVSPLSNHQFKTPLTPSKMTPRTGKLVSIGDALGSAEKFRGINSYMRLAKGRNALVSPGGRKSSKRLSFDQMEGPGVGSEEESQPMFLGKKKRLTEPAPSTTQ